MARDDLHFRLRIPESLKARVESAAKENRRSMTAEIVAALEKEYPAPNPKKDEMRKIIEEGISEMSNEMSEVDEVRMNDILEKLAQIALDE